MILLPPSAARRPLDRNQCRVRAAVNISCRLADTIGFPSFHGVELTPYAELIEELPTIEHSPPYYGIDNLTAEVRTKMEGVESI